MSESKIVNEPASPPAETLQIRIYGDDSLSTLIYLPGVHGDWTLVGSFREALAGQVRWVEFAYPRTLDWSLRDYAGAIESLLLAHGIQEGWLLGESFGSQVAWQLLQKAYLPAPGAKASGESPVSDDKTSIHWNGLILAGGFGRHPMILTARLARFLWDVTPLFFLRLFLRFYLRFAKFRHRHAPETLSHINDFYIRRNAQDRLAMSHRLGLLIDNYPGQIIKKATLPVYYLSGWIDPVVPWPMVRAYLRRDCPGFREAHIIWPADHNILGTAPKAAAQLVLQWIRSESKAHLQDPAQRSQ